MQQAGQLAIAETLVVEPQNVARTDAENLRRSAKVKGKAIMIHEEPEAADIANINPNDFEKPIEVKVYRKWTSRNVPDPNPTSICFILLDKKVSCNYISFETTEISQAKPSLSRATLYK